MRDDTKGEMFQESFDHGSLDVLRNKEITVSLLNATVCNDKLKRVDIFIAKEKLELILRV